MKALTNKRDLADETASLEALNQIRLNRNWSYPQLAADMARAGFPVQAATLQALLTRRRAKPYDRTIYQIRQYLASLEGSEQVPA